MHVRPQGGGVGEGSVLVGRGLQEPGQSHWEPRRCLVFAGSPQLSRSHFLLLTDRQPPSQVVKSSPSLLLQRAATNLDIVVPLPGSWGGTLAWFRSCLGI